MLLGKFVKQPEEIEAYGVRYDDATEYEETVSSATAAVEDLAGGVPSATLSSCVIVEKEVRVQATGGDDGHDYKITLTVNTSTGRRLQDEIILKVREV